MWVWDEAGKRGSIFFYVGAIESHLGLSREVIWFEYWKNGLDDIIQQGKKIKRTGRKLSLFTDK